MLKVSNKIHVYPNSIGPYRGPAEREILKALQTSGEFMVMFSQKILKVRVLKMSFPMFSEGHFKIGKGNADRGQGRVHFSFLASL